MEGWTKILNVRQDVDKQASANRCVGNERMCIKNCKLLQKMKECDRGNLNSFINKSIDLRKSMDLFLYDRDLCHGRLKDQ